MFMVLSSWVSWLSHCESSPSSCDECGMWNSSRWLPTFWPSRPTRAIGPPVGS